MHRVRAPDHGGIRRGRRASRGTDVAPVGVPARLRLHGAANAARANRRRVDRTPTEAGPPEDVNTDTGQRTLPADRRRSSKRVRRPPVEASSCVRLRPCVPEWMRPSCFYRDTETFEHLITRCCFVHSWNGLCIGWHGDIGTESAIVCKPITPGSQPDACVRRCTGYPLD
jgi:hypothetical protein